MAVWIQLAAAGGDLVVVAGVVCLLSDHLVSAGRIGQTASKLGLAPRDRGGGRKLHGAGRAGRY
jgi:hypothetical protein